MSPKRETALQLWGRELARAREAAGVSQEALANEIYVSHSLVAMWETGRRAPKLNDVARCEDALGTGGYLARLLTEWVPREVPPQWLDKWLSIEERATSLLSFQPMLVPGLLQTEDYARAVLRAGRRDLADTEEMMSSRLERQRILDRDHSPVLVALLDESVLQRNVGGPEVMADQLTHLSRMAERDNIVVQVVPLTASVCAGFSGPFVLASFDGGNEVAYLDNAISGDVVEGAKDVAEVRRRWELLRADALPQQLSVDLIRKVVAERWPIT